MHFKINAKVHSDNAMFVNIAIKHLVKKQIMNNIVKFIKMSHHFLVNFVKDSSIKDMI